MSFTFPSTLARSCAKSDDRKTWLGALPDVIDELVSRWSITELGAPFDGEDVSCSWVAPVTFGGGRAVLKVGMPHMEGEDEIAALRFLDGQPTVRLIESDEQYNAMLLERCDPGSSLRSVFQPDQDVVIAGLLKKFWRAASGGPFRSLSTLIAHWTRETREDESRWHQRGLVAEGLAVLDHLSESSGSDTLLATDLHAGNVLKAKREPWLVIDPKPFVGDTAFDATQHLLNCRSRLRTDAAGTIHRFADMLEVDYKRVRLWTFGRLSAEPRDDWDDEASALAKLIGRSL
ncbi:MAG TPA: aminoglycoside phosphotransferase family protein [Gemmatimonadaceae bacterium]|nr:aminoglycoside phosphotransferase family protein [Gemmatimonadaceae bacterium]